MNKAMLSQKRRRIQAYVFWLVVIGLLTAAAFFARQGDSDLSFVLVSGAVGAIIGVFVSLPIWLWFCWRRSGFDGKKVTVNVTAESLCGAYQGVFSRIDWDACVRYSELKTHAFVWVSKIQAVVLPFNAFDNESQRDEFLNFIRARVQPAAIDKD
ncbi:MAG: YcxB family protein [Rhizobiaceae bacterium]